MDRLNEQMNHRMEIVRQLRAQEEGGYKPEDYEGPKIGNSFRIRIFLTVVFVFFVFSIKTTEYNGLATKVIKYFNHNSSVEVAVDNFRSDLIVVKNKLIR